VLPEEDGLATPPESAPDADLPPAPDSEPPANGCPTADQIGGAYSGNFTGTLQALIPINLQGAISFTLQPDGVDFKLVNGKATGDLLGVAFDIPIQGTVICGSLNGAGTGDISGVQFSGQFLATWSAGGFTNGSWNGQDTASGTSGNGTWTATR
jgi:hypothetical protein